MKLIATIVITFAIAVGLALVSMDDPGYIVLSRDPYIVRMPLLMFVLLLFVGFVLLYLLINLIVGVFRAPKKIGQWKSSSSENSAHKHTMLGYAGLIEGNWSKAEQSLLKNIQYNKTPLMNYLGAAYAAHQQGSLERRNNYLDDALKDHPAQELAINLTRARLLHQAGEYASARDCLESLRKSAPRNAPVVRLLADVYRELGDWSSLIALMPVGKKLKAFSDEEFVAKEQLAFKSMADSPALLQGESGSNATSWEALPKKRKKDPQLIISYARQLIGAGKHKEAEKVLRSALHREFRDDLISIYGSVNSQFLEYQIQLAESFLKKHANHPGLLHTLAKFYYYDENFKRSAEYFEKAIDAGAGQDVYLDYAGLLEQMGDTDRALHYMKKGAATLLEGDASSPQASNSGELVALDSAADGQLKEVMPVVK